jgi:prepilin-type N-terminal cleavage/methylation domain-containing protein
MKKAFSLIELLVTCAIIAILVGIVIGVYNNINNSAVAVAQQKDTAELNQVMGMLHMSGGNIAAIIGTPPLVALNPTTAAKQAAQLTLLLRNNLNVNSKTQKGTVGGSTLPTTEALIPYPYISGSDDGRNRLVFNLTSGLPSIQTSGQGFIVVNKNASKDYKSFSSYPYSSAYRQYINTIGNPSAAVSDTTGSKYAISNAYVWNEDAAPTASPEPNPTVPSLIQVGFVFAYGPSVDIRNNVANGTTIGTGAYNYTDYTGQTTAAFPNPGPLATVYAFAYNEDANGQALNANQVSLGATIGGNSAAVSVSGPYAATDSNDIPAPLFAALQNNNLGSQQGLVMTITGLNSAFPASSWTTSSVPLTVTAGGIADSSVTTAISASSVVAGTPSVPSSLSAGSTASSFAANSSDPGGVIAVLPSLTDTSSGATATATLGSTSLTFTDPGVIDVTLNASGSGSDADSSWNQSVTDESDDGDGG